MAKSAKAAPVEAVEVEETEEVAKDYSVYLTKEPGALYEHLLNWVKEQTGVEFASAKEEKAFDLGVKLTLALRTHHQSSPENQERLAEAAAAREAAAKAAKAQRDVPKSADTDEDEAEAPKTGKKAKATPATVAPAKAGPKKAKTGTSKAPF